MISFVKMHGIGNDYVYVDAVSRPELDARDDLADLARRISDRHRGVGADGLILVCRPTRPGAHVRMRMFNADGSESEMCGNGVRCVAKFAHDRLGVNAQPMLVETGRGVLAIEYTTVEGRLTTASVDMGEPVFDLPGIPADESRLAPSPDRPHEWLIQAAGQAWSAVLLSMGNPHAVIFTADLDAVDLERIGPAIERHPAFPNRVNVHFARAHAPPTGDATNADPRPATEATMRTWERGSGITLACGTGACAVAAAGLRTGRLARESLIHLPGGDLRITIRNGQRRGPSDTVIMTGPAEDVFEGQWPA